MKGPGDRRLSVQVLAALSKIANSIDFSRVKRDADGNPESYDVTKERLAAEMAQLQDELAEVQRAGNHARAAELMFRDIPLAERGLGEWRKLN